MNQRQIELVRDTFVNALLAPEEAAGHFYAHLFEHAPETRALFSDDMAQQERRLISAMAKIVAGLARPDAMRPTIEALARRHVTYGAEQRHYAVVGDAMLHMIRRISAVDPGSPADDAWRAAYATIADIMIAAAYPPRDTPVTTPTS